MNIYFTVFIFIFGAIIGSFLNVYTIIESNAFNSEEINASIEELAATIQNISRSIESLRKMAKDLEENAFNRK